VTEHEFPRSLDREGRASWVATLILLSLRIRIFFFGAVYNQRRNMMDELKVWITAAISNVTKDVLQCFWQEVDYRSDVCRAIGGSQCEVFHTLKLSDLYAKKSYMYWWIKYCKQ
jgi:hypothetical protein